jgi:hypothetical protein
MADLDDRLRARGEAWRGAQPPVASGVVDRAMARRMRRPIALALVAASILLVVVGAVLLADNDDEQLTVTRPGPSSTTESTTLTPLQDAVRRVEGDGWIVRDHEMARDPETTFADEGLSFIKGVAPSVSGRGARFYFFIDGRLAGTDGDGSQDADVVSNDGTTISIRYVLYKSTDPGCCPTGGEAIVRFEQRGAEVVPIDPLPGRWPETEPVGR